MDKSISRIQDVILDGALKAQKRFERMTGGFWTGDYPVEYFLTAGIGEYFFKLHPGACVILEAKYADLTENIRSKPRGRHTEFQKSNQRLDIVFYDYNWSPFSIVEVKRWLNDKVIDDLSRSMREASRLSRQSGTIDQVHAVFFSHGFSDTSKKHCLQQLTYKAEGDIEKIRAEFQNIIPKQGKHHLYEGDDKEFWACKPICVSLNVI